MRAMNERYGRKVSDTEFIQRVIKGGQSKIDTVREDCENSPEGDCYCSDGMKDMILNWLDELSIYPDDIDAIFAELDF